MDRLGAGGRLRVMRVIARMNVGGPARQVAVLGRHLDSERFEQCLLVGSVGAGEIDDMGLREVDLPHERVAGLGRAPRGFDDFHALVTIASRVHRFRPHIVHTHTAKAGVLGRVASVLASTAPGRRPALVHTFHGHLLHGYFSPRVTTAVVSAERVLARRTDRLVAVGRQVRDELVATGIGRADRWEVVPPGIELRAIPDRAEARAAMGVAAKATVVAYVARLTAVKRPDRFIEVASRVAALHPGVVFVVAGGGELAGDLVERAAAVGLKEPQLRMLGWTADVEAVYAAADVVLLTSDNEGMPVSLIEAALAGRPAVTPEVGSAAEVVVHGETGFVAPAGDAVALAHCVVRLLDDDGLRRAMGTAAGDRASRLFSAKRLVADTERIYSELASERGWW